jgi:hypothetical protein
VQANLPGDTNAFFYLTKCGVQNKSSLLLILSPRSKGRLHPQKRVQPRKLSEKQEADDETTGYSRGATPSTRTVETGCRYRVDGINSRNSQEQGDDVANESTEEPLENAPRARMVSAVVGDVEEHLVQEFLIIRPADNHNDVARTFSSSRCCCGRPDDK